MLLKKMAEQSANAINQLNLKIMKNIMLSIISKNPIHNNYMLYCPVTPIFPYFGSLKKCRKAQVVFEKKLREEFNKINDEEKKEILSMLEYYRKRNGDYSIESQKQ